MLPIIRSRTVKRFSFGAKPAEGTHVCTNCGPPRAEASARRSHRDRIDQAMCDLRFGLLSFGPQLAKGRDGYEAGLRGAKLRPADGLRHHHSDMQSPVQPTAERTGVASEESSSPPRDGCGLPHIRASSPIEQELSDATLPSAASGGERHTPFKRRHASGWDNAVHRLLCLFVRPKT